MDAPGVSFLTLSFAMAASGLASSVGLESPFDGSSLWELAELGGAGADASCAACIESGNSAQLTSSKVATERTRIDNRDTRFTAPSTFPDLPDRPRGGTERILPPAIYK